MALKCRRQGTVPVLVLLLLLVVETALLFSGYLVWGIAATVTAEQQHRGQGAALTTLLLGSLFVGWVCFRVALWRWRRHPEPAWSQTKRHKN